MNTTEIKLPPGPCGHRPVRLRMNRYIETDGRRRGAAAPARLWADFRAALPRTTHPLGQSPLAMLEDIVIRQIDIRVPLDQPRAVPDGRMRLVAEYLDGNSFYPARSWPKVSGCRQPTPTDHG